MAISVVFRNLCHFSNIINKTGVTHDFLGIRDGATI
jgi:hypothetical protein